MQWDFFISHASEDKADVVIPLAQQLERAGYRVWLDAFELKIGESLRSRIDHGLNQSRFGIVIVSAAYITKKWPAAELSALFALDDPSDPRILPIWHNVDADSVVKISPLLASRVAITTEEGGGASQLARTIIRQLGDRLSDPGTVVNRFVSKLETADVSSVRAFLIHYPHLLAYAAGLTYGSNLRVYFRSDDDYPKSDWGPDIILELYFPPDQPSLPGHSSFFVITLGPLLLSEGADHLVDARHAVDATCEFVDRFSRKHKWNHSDVSGVIALSRRTDVTVADIEGLANAQQVRIRTYDWLVDAFLKCGQPSRHVSTKVIVGSSHFNDGE